VTRGRAWGSFLEVRENAAESYLLHAQRERAWARRSRGEFSIFMASATEPFPVAERRFRISQQVLEAMREEPPDLLIVQTHTADVARYADLLHGLPRVRVHISIETDRERLPGLPPPASPVQARFEAARALHESGLEVAITVSPLLPIEDPERFFERIARSAGAVVLDHYVGGDGTPDGSRTARTPVPAVMESLEPGCTKLDYRGRMVEVARRIMPGRVGVYTDGFAARYF
jgi:DNA repair photolyase